MLTKSSLFTLLFSVVFVCVLSGQSQGMYQGEPDRSALPPTNPQTVYGSLSRLYSNTQCGLEYQMQSVRLGQRFSPQGSAQPAPIVFNTIPVCANILKVFAWTEVLGYGSIPVQLNITDSVAFDSSYVMTLTGSSIDVCWTMGGTHAYRADITGAITCNGTYWVSGLPTSTDQDNYDIEGITIMVIYTNPNSTSTGTLILDDGNITSRADTVNYTMNNYSVCGTPMNAQALYVVGDKQFDGYTWDWNTTNLTEPNWNWWNSSSHAIPMTINDTTSSFTLRDSADCFSLLVTGIYFNSNCNTCSVSNILNVNVATAANTCNGNGSATVNVTGGTPPYTYQLNTNQPQSQSTFANLSPGIYTVQVRDAAGSCSGQQFTIVNSSLTISAIATVDARCTAPGSCTVTVTGGSTPYTYSWDNSLPVGSNTIGNLAIGNHSVLITDVNGACAYGVFAINNDSNYYVTVARTNSLCNAPTGTATATMINGAAPYSYQWSTMPVQTTATATGLAAGTYWVTVTDSLGCVANMFANIGQGPLPSFLTYLVSKDSVCNQVGLNSGKVRIGAITGGVGPFSCWWQTNPIQYNDTAFGLAAGTYLVSVLDSGTGCIRTTSRIVTSVPAFDVNLSKTAVTCSNNGTASVSTIVGGDAPFTYSWHTTPVQTTNSISGLTPGYYAVTVTDSRGCMIVDSINVNSNPLYNINYGYSALHKCDSFYTDSALFHASVSGGGVAPFTYQWGTVPPTFNDSIYFSSPDTVLLTVTDANGCVNTRTIYCPAVDEFTVALQTTPGCSNTNGTATVTMPTSPSYTYVWNTIPPTNGVSVSAPPGVYQVSVTNLTGCTITKSVTISNGTAIDVQPASWEAHCDTIAGSVYAYINGGIPPYTYIWNASSQLTTPGLWGLSPATYSVQVTDQCGNSDTGSVIVTGNGFLGVASTMIPPTCSDSAIAYLTPTFGAPPYIFNWNTTPVQNGDTLQNPVPGNYSYSVTDSNGCQTFGSFSIPSTPFSITVSNSVQSNCMDTVVFTASSIEPSAVYTWQPGNIINDSLQVLALNSSSFTVTATAACGTISDTVSVTILPNTNTISICGVSVDTALNKNAVSWDIPGGFNFGNYCVFRESLPNSGIYNPIATVPATASGYYLDPSANPSVSDYRYKLGTIDSCGDTSMLSTPHKTIYTTISAGSNNSWDISWTPYSGAGITNYLIYSSFNNNAYTLLGTVNSTTFTFNDPNPPGVVTNYCIAATTTSSCNNQTTTNYMSYSNVVAGSFVGINPDPDQLAISVYPNPTSGSFQLVTAVPVNYKLTDLAGKEVMNGNCMSGTNSISTSDLSSGVYFLIIADDSGNLHTEQLIIEKE